MSDKKTKKRPKKVESKKVDNNGDISLLDWFYDDLGILPTNSVRDLNIVRRGSFELGELKSQITKGNNFVTLYDLYADYTYKAGNDIKTLGGFCSILNLLDLKLHQHANYAGYYVKPKLI